MSDPKYITSIPDGLGGANHFDDQKSLFSDEAIDFCNAYTMLNDNTPAPNADMEKRLKTYRK